MLSIGIVLLSNTTFAQEPNKDGESPIVFKPFSPDQTPTIQDENPDMELPPGVKFQTRSEARNADIENLSNGLNLPREDVEEIIDFHDAFRLYVQKIRTHYPDKISGVWVEPGQGIGNIRFVGDIPPDILVEIEERGQEEKIVLTGGGSISQNDHPHRTHLVVETLANDLKLKNFSTYYNEREDNVFIEIMRPKEAAILNKADILEAIRNRVKKSRLQGVIAIFNLDDIKLKVYIGTEPIATPKTRKANNWGQGQSKIKF